MWGFLGIGKDNTTFTRADASTFRNVALISLCVGGCCSFLFHVIVKYESQEGNQETTNGVIADLENNENVIEEVSSIGRSEDVLVSNVVTVGPLQGNHTETETVRPRHIHNNESQQMKTIDWLLEPQLYQVALLYMCTRLFVNLSQTYMPLYLNVSLQLPQMYVAIIPMVMYVSGIFMAVVTKSVSKRLGKKFAYGIACLLGGTGCLWIHWGMENIFSLFLMFITW